MATIIGSARIDERGKLSGGTAGDQKQSSSTNDRVGEVSMQNFYLHSRGWYILRPKDANIANKIAVNMKTACNNPNIGYDQGNRLGIITYGVNTKTKTECDCSSLVRQCIKEASGKDPGNFTTANEASMLETSGLFESKKSYTSGTTLYTGDVLVTKTKGHTAIVTDGVSRSTNSSTSTNTSRKYSVGQVVTYSSCYKASTDGVEKAVMCSPYKSGTITKVLTTNVNNPYLINNGTCWLNDGDIRSIVGTNSNNSNNSSSSDTYTHSDFVKDVQKAIGAKVDGIAGNETLSKTVTVSKTKNSRHAVVKPIQKYLNSIGYNCGKADGIAGVKFDTAVKAYQRANGCVADGEITKGNKTWKALLKLD